MDKIINQIKLKTNMIRVPGDKSITHRSIIISAMANGQSIVRNYLQGDDCLRTKKMLEDMGVKIKQDKDTLIINGVGIDGLSQPKNVLDSGNSGTTIRLMSGIIAGQNLSAEITGDDSLSKRPMKRIIEPLSKMSVKITAANEQYLPIKITGNPDLTPVSYELPVASAQVKSCILFAGMQAMGITEITEPTETRNHTERMLQHFGVKISKTKNRISIQGPVNYNNNEITVPGDFSSAAFFIVAGLLVPDTKIKIQNVNINSTRTGLLTVLQQMGADIKIENKKNINNEPCGDIIVKTSKLKGITVSNPVLIASMIDEIPVLCLAATQATGQTIIRGAKELRVKESDRIKTITSELIKLGAKITELEDGFIIDGPSKLNGTVTNSYNDHRIAMTLAIAGLVSEGRLTIQNSDCVAISFPSFWDYFDIK